MIDNYPNFMSRADLFHVGERTDFRQEKIDRINNKIDRVREEIDQANDRLHELIDERSRLEFGDECD